MHFVAPAAAFARAGARRAPAGLDGPDRAASNRRMAAEERPFEVLLAPLWVFLRFGDLPSEWTVAGGIMLLATLVAHECVGLRRAMEATMVDTEEEEDRPYVAADTSCGSEPLQ